MRQVTQGDIAKALGLSRQTVALVIGKTDSPLRKHLNPETVRRIQEKAAEMGYSANYNARMLTQRRSNLIILLNFNLYNERTGKQIYHLGQLAHAAGYDLRVIEAQWWVENAQALIEQIVSFRPEGVIMEGTSSVLFDPHHVEELTRRGIPIVSFAGADIEGIPTVRYDTRESTRQITEHAIRSGRRKLALLQANRDTWQRQQKIDGFRDALREAGAGQPEEYGLDYSFLNQSTGVQSVILFDPSRDGGFPDFNLKVAAIERVLGSSEIPDALLCTNDHYGMAALKVCHQREIAVPDTLSVSGCDGMEYGAMAGISLTSIRLPIEAMSEASLKMLITRITKEGGSQSSSEKKLFPCEVIWRESTDPVEQSSLLSSQVS
ncbi:MAG: LacI family DNA-binding transcriptional regulator [Chthoniobacterales bacterium]